MLLSLKYVHTYTHTHIFLLKSCKILQYMSHHTKRTNTRHNFLIRSLYREAWIEKNFKLRNFATLWEMGALQCFLGWARHRDAVIWIASGGELQNETVCFTLPGHIFMHWRSWFNKWSLMWRKTMTAKVILSLLFVCCFPRLQTCRFL